MKIKPFKNIVPLILIAANVLLAILLILDFKIAYEANFQFSAAQDKISSLKKAKATAKHFKEKETADQESALKLKLPEDSTVPLEAIREAVEIAKGLGIKDISVYPKSELTKAPSGISAEVVPFEMKVNCEYGKISDFLKMLPKSHSLLQVAELEITRDNNNLPNLNATLLINTYTILTTKDKALPKGKNKGSPGKTP